MKNFPDGYRAVVVGANGGIGGAFFDALNDDPACGEVIGISRSSEPRIDLLQEETIRRAAEAIGGAGPVHLLICATGLLHDARMQPEKSIHAVDPETMARSFAINATGPLLLLKHFHRHFPKAERSVFASLSARVGSIADNRLGGWYGYRASKAALNMFLRTAAIELARKRPQAICIALHPGTVRTRLSDPFSADRDRFDADKSAAMLIEVIDAAPSSGAGSFLAYDGTEIPW